MRYRPGAHGREADRARRRQTDLPLTLEFPAGRPLNALPEGAFLHSVSQIRAL